MRSIVASILLLQVMLERSIVVQAFSLPAGPACRQISRTNQYDKDASSLPIPRLQTSADTHELLTENEADDTNDTSSPSNEDSDDDSKPATFSKVKWKKKRYLMIQDVMKLIKNGDSRAPRKAEENVARMLKLSDIHQDDDLRPNEQVYNVRHQKN